MKVFLGRVVENKLYSKTGYIDVMLPQEEEEMGGERFFVEEYSNKDIPSMLPSYEEGFRGDGITHRCSVLSPIGTGSNYGAAYIPQINSVGLVMQLEAGNAPSWTTDDCYIWLGGLYGTKIYGRDRNLPMDDTLSDQLNNEDVALIANDEDRNDIDESGYVEEGMMLIKLKTVRTAGDYLNADDIEEKHIHYDTTPTENTIVFRKTKAGFRHNSYDAEDKRVLIEDITLDNEKTKISRFKNEDGSDDERTEQILLFDDEQAELQFLNKKTKINRTIIFDDEKIQLQFDDPEGKKNHLLEFNNDGNKMTLDFKNDDSQKDHMLIFEDDQITLKMSNDGDGKDVTFVLDKDGKLNIHTSDDITITNEGSSNITVDKDCTLNVSGDVNITASKNITAKSDNATVEANQIILNGKTSTQVKGGMLQIKGQATPDMQGPMCALQYCLVTGAPHIGSQTTLTEK